MFGFDDLRDVLYTSELSHASHIGESSAMEASNYSISVDYLSGQLMFLRTYLLRAKGKF